MLNQFVTSCYHSIHVSPRYDTLHIKPMKLLWIWLRENLLVYIGVLIELINTITELLGKELAGLSVPTEPRPDPFNSSGLQRSDNPLFKM